MPRIVTVGIAQLGPIPRSQSRPEVVLRLLALMEGKAALPPPVLPLRLMERGTTARL